MKKDFLALLIPVFIVACTAKPKIIEAEPTTTKTYSSPETATTETTAKIEPPSGGITISELYANRAKYDGQIVSVKGKSIKVNNMIMNRNWIHIQDGSSGDSNQDLTVTTMDDVSLGEIVAFQGKIALNKDFGSGYKYEVIMEEAKRIK
jgi:hypothetical protein